MPRRMLLIVLSCGLACGAALVAPSRAEEAPARTLPRLADPSASKEVTGRIGASTRGKAGPVRLVLELDQGKELAVLVAPDPLCDRLGLSLEPGEEITVIGHQLVGVRPLLVARAVIVDGRRVEVRDEDGGWVKETTPKAPEAPEAAPSAPPA